MILENNMRSGHGQCHCTRVQYSAIIPSACLGTIIIVQALQFLTPVKALLSFHCRLSNKLRPVVEANFPQQDQISSMSASGISSGSGASWLVLAFFDFFRGGWAGATGVLSVTGCQLP